MKGSLVNIMKNVLVCSGEMERGGNISAMRAAIRRLKVAQPVEWFKHTVAEGCLWLNTALTCAPARKSEHAKFWKPIVHKARLVGRVGRGCRPCRWLAPIPIVV